MNRSRIISHIFVVVFFVFVSSANAAQHETTKMSNKSGLGKCKRCYGKTVGCPSLGRHFLAAAVNKQANKQINSAAARVVVGAAVDSAIRHTLSNNVPQSKELLKADRVLYFAGNAIVRAGAECTAAYGFEVSGLIKKAYDAVVPEGAIKDAVGGLAADLAPFAEEFVYDSIAQIAVNQALKPWRD